ncbi:1-(5-PHOSPHORIBOSYL)-5-[(5-PHOSPHORIBOSYLAMINO)METHYLIDENEAMINO] IMIDAZOLE-4-CARBOXAMIDE ISOMERASE [Salix purpurea]|uniref:1-(5-PHOSPHORIBOSYL)-5-[(5-PHOSPHORIBOSYLAMINO)METHYLIDENEAMINO] IMIDAZOLE-4-CARBOXAMIDE ISOMERASE n=1 Tax=Salix purpurea TaxID=77065 RepID=A0A9Q0WGK3_SALPP|nr:1-(5-PHOSPHORIBOSYL)-5-[(5-PHOSPHORIBOSYLAMINO)METHYLIDENEAMINO] IMIDAZOLE-4-CARBOXAMIDE ISOMERASE [Salix purpurea]
MPLLHPPLSFSLQESSALHYFMVFKGTTEADSLHPSLLSMPSLGKVKQIVGPTLRDLKGEDGSALVTNFESDETAAEFANLHKEDGLMGGADDLSKSIAIEELFVGLRLLSLVDWICSPLFEMLAFAISVVLPENDSSKIHFYLSHK